MSYAILHIPSGNLYIDEQWIYYEHLSYTHMEYFIHAFNHSMVPMNQYARNFRNWCNENKITPGIDTEFEILTNYECKKIEPINEE
jgi:hypothetical protein